MPLDAAGFGLRLDLWGAEAFLRYSTAMGGQPRRERLPSKDEMVRVRELFRRWGSEGGRKRSSILSGEERRAIARQAARARWDRAPIEVRRPLKTSPSRTTSSSSTA